MLRILTLTIMISLISACATPSQSIRIAGGVAGAVIAHKQDKNKAAGALIGLGIGQVIASSVNPF